MYTELYLFFFSMQMTVKFQDIFQGLLSIEILNTIKFTLTLGY
ncbi:hypothetical protein HMPREF0083_00253 [Aneurinibacillus aneurinilyticus ATCC 12856]|uniref:Uncharacterized protein n=1 Tax=Aneurinibacillus aneurinilyticus ATCC 12856 TaxID=649747 RepID=U1YLG4_ANEAE|nr:hypothetical protein HMPREF0083_00253 [Aneurinibacillus aneurinilyticus ATCC 12856]